MSRSPPLPLLAEAASAATAARDPAVSPDAPEAVYGVLQLGAASVALPLDALSEVIPCPARFGALPATADGLLGAVAVRGKVVPVLDLRSILKWPAGDAASELIVLMRHEGRLLGLQADRARGLTRLRPARVHRMDTSEGGLLFSGSFEHEDQSVVSVLDPAAILRLPGVPHLRDEGEAAHAARSSASDRVPLMLVRCGSIGLAIDVTSIHTTLARVALQSSSLDGSVCRGVIEHAAQRLPAVDPLALMGLGRLPAGEPCQALLLRYGSGFVALLVSEVIDIARVPPTALAPLSPLAVQRPAFFRAVLRVPQRGEHLVLARDALHDDPELRSLATLNTRLASDAPGAAAAGARGQAVITYELGAEVATRLTQVSEVLPLPPAYLRAENANAAVLGLFSHRGHTVTLACLATLLGLHAPREGADARVLLVELDGAHFGFVVPRLCHIENTVWEQPRAKVATSVQASPGPLGRHALVELGQGATRRTLHLINLRALIRTLLSTAPASPDRSAVAAAA